MRPIDNRTDARVAGSTAVATELGAVRLSQDFTHFGKSEWERRLFADHTAGSET